MRLTIVCLTMLATAVGLRAEPGLDRAIEKALHRIDRSAGAYTAFNPSQHLQANFAPTGTDFVHNGRQFRVALLAAGPVGDITVQDNRIDIQRGRVTEWYINAGRGIEHGFTVAHKDGPLHLRLTVTGDYRPATDALGVTLLDPSTGKIALRYGGLTSWDAAGRTLPSHAEVVGNEIHLLVDDSNARYPVTVDPIFHEPVLQASNGTAGDLFGVSLAATADLAVVGAPVKDGGTGAVYVFNRFKQEWTEQARLPSPAPAGARFGQSVAISGNTIVAGAPLETVNSSPRAGAAYVFTWNGSSWTQQQRIVPLDPQAMAGFGSSVAVDNNTVIIGAPHLEETNFGFGAYVFARSNGFWAQETKLVIGSEVVGVQNFGLAVSVYGDTVAVGSLEGAVANGSTQGGIVEVFTRSGTLWSRQAALGVPDGTVNNTKGKRFGRSLSLNGNFLLVGAPGSAQVPSAAYVFFRGYLDWNPISKLTASDTRLGDAFGASVALYGYAAVIGAPGAGSSGAAYLFNGTLSSWSESVQLTPPSTLPQSANYGYSVAFAGPYVLVAAPNSNSTKGEVYSFRLQNVTLQSNPPGQTFSLSGSGCVNGTFTAPYTTYLTNCSIEWTSPKLSTRGTRFTFREWQNGSTTNPYVPNPMDTVISFNPTIPSSTFTANFLTEYQLTTQTLPSSAGSVTGAAWYPAGTQAAVAAVPNPGFIFTGFSGDLTGFPSPKTVLMDAPKSVTGNFTTTPPAALSGLVSGKSGNLSNNRQWTITVTNNGPGIAYNAQLFLMMFTQTFGTPCTAGPVRLTPPTLPVPLGTLAAGQSASAQLSFDFSACPANARFTVTLGYMSNGGSFGGYVQLANQFQ